MAKQTKGAFGRRRTLKDEIAVAVETGDVKMIARLIAENRTKNGRPPKGLRASEIQPRLHEQIRARHNSNPSKTTLKREALSLQRDRLRAKSKARKKAKRLATKSGGVK